MSEYDYEKGKTNDLIETTGFSNPMYNENCKHFKIHRTNGTIIIILHKLLYRRTMMTTTEAEALQYLSLLSLCMFLIICYVYN